MANEKERPEVTPVVDISKREPSTGQKIFKEFFKSDFKTLRKWVIKDVLIPGIQNLILNGLSRLFFESDYSDKSSVGERSSISRGRSRVVPYNKAYKGNLSTGRREEPTVDDDEDYIPDYRNELVLPTEKDAIRVIESMKNMIEDYDDATVAQLYKLCTITHPDFQMNKWGWDANAFKGATYRRVRDGWCLMIPEAIYLSE